MGFWIGFIVGIISTIVFLVLFSKAIIIFIAKRKLKNISNSLMTHMSKFQDNNKNDNQIKYKEVN